MVIKMYNINKLSAAALLIALVLTACPDPQDNNSGIDGENPYKGETLTVSNELVWKRNSHATKISNVYLEYNENHHIDAFVQVVKIEKKDDDNDNVTLDRVVVGSGDIVDRVLTFSTDAIADDKLMSWPGLSYKYEGDNYITASWKSFFREWPDADISNKNVLGNMILLDASNNVSGEIEYKGMLDRQKITGTDTTITCETILYFYVNDDCVITGTKNNGYISGQYYYYTEGDLHLSLKKGVNLVSRTETYGTTFSGSAHIGMEVRDPIEKPENYKWVIEPGFGLQGIHF